MGLEDWVGAASSWVSKTYLTQGLQGLRSREKAFKSLLSNRKLPEEGWDDESITMFIKDLALMDTNNFLHNAGVGERDIAAKNIRERYRTHNSFKIIQDSMCKLNSCSKQ